MSNAPPSDERQITYNSDGSVEISKGEQAAIVHPDGSISLNISVAIMKIGLDNIIDLAAYSISRNDDLVIHQFAFRSGANGEIVYTTKGKIKTFAVRGCGVSVSKVGEVVISGDATRSETASPTQVN